MSASIISARMYRSASIAAHAQFSLAISGAKQWVQDRSAEVPRRTLHNEHILAIHSPVTHKQSAKGLLNAGHRGRAIVSRLSCASGRLINNITALLSHKRHNVFFSTCMALDMLGLHYKSVGPRAALLKWTVSAVLLVQVF